jgi:hypothetical protein
MDTRTICRSLFLLTEVKSPEYVLLGLFYCYAAAEALCRLLMYLTSSQTDKVHEPHSTVTTFLVISNGGFIKGTIILLKLFLS